jgi:hypothetical protein
MSPVMTVTDRVAKMIRDRQVRCPICGAGWSLARMDARSLRIVEEAVRRHVEEHARISAGRSVSERR